jgi:hypothetical protein
MKEKLIRFMTGRNGNDELNRFLLGADLALILLATIFSRSTAGRLLMPLALVLLGLTYFRMFSRNRMRRSEENARFLLLRQRILGEARCWKEQWAQRKDYKFFVCPSCKTRLRVPKGRGKIKIVCRKCGNSFTGKS